MDKHVFKLFCLAVLLGIFAIALGGCKSITGFSINEIPHETSKGQEIYFCPRDDCGKAYSLLIGTANNSVHCAFYDIDLKNVIMALANKSKAAEVMLVMDKSNYKEQVKGEGVKLDDDGQLMHNKFCVIDDEIVITGSFNPTDNDNFKNNNNVIVSYSNALASNYEQEFQELWNSEFGKGGKVVIPKINLNNKSIENYFCPEDDCASRTASLIQEAKRSIYFMTFSFTNEGIGNALIKKKALDIRGVFDSEQASIQYSQFKRLKEIGIKVKKDSNRYKMHHKVFVIDNETVLTGSFNPTSNADTNNDENIIIIHDKRIADGFLDEFDRVWG